MKVPLFLAGLLVLIPFAAIFVVTMLIEALRSTHRAPRPRHGFRGLVPVLALFLSLSGGLRVVAASVVDNPARSSLAATVAQGTPPAQGDDSNHGNLLVFAAWGGGLIAVVNIIGAARKFLGVKEEPAERKIANQPLRVMQQERYITREEFEKLEADVRALHGTVATAKDNLSAQISSQFVTLQHARSVSIAQLHTRITDTADALRDEIANMPQKVITILRDTGALGHGKPR